ncbi:MAG: T9SS type A sorting domain-containing protein [Candidatus Aegiribacteria sp.]|nr:T9SS type A sorting domain-containing protein [Candidatus Aegiribacteria sp.]
MKKLIYVLFFLFAVSFSETAGQTDWSAGDGVPGPVTDWGNSYDFSTRINSTSVTLRLNLITPIMHIVDGYFDGAVSVYAADVDGDGDMDVLGAAKAADDIVWWENTNGSGTAWVKRTIDGNFDGAMTVYATDVDGDGDIDVLGAAKAADDIVWWENSNGSGTAWIKHTVDGFFDGAMSVYAADVDGDGDIDVLGAAKADDDITWWENSNGSGTAWIKHTVDGFFDGAMSVYAADIDGDGDIDVLGAAKADDDITWWENANGSGTAWIEHSVDGNFNHAESVYAADVDGDGDMDVLGAAEWDDDITWWENANGSGTVWIEHTVDGDFEAALSVYAADVDGDGDIDVLGSGRGGYVITWWENANGSGTVWIEHKVNETYNSAASDNVDTDRYDGITSVYAADLDGEGGMDVLGAVSGTDEIIWWDVMRYLEKGNLESSILDAGSVSSWETFSSNSEEPVGTSVAFQFRSSSNAANMGAWSDIIFSSGTGLSDILADSTRYLQYRVILETSDSLNTPVLDDVLFSYNSGDITSWALLPAMNPSFGYLAVMITVPEPGMVKLVVCDLSGRIIANSSEEFSIGTHSVNFHGLGEGVYFCVMRAGKFTATERVIVLE